MRIAGIDPGATGAVAVYDTELGTLEIFDTPVAAVKVGTRNVNRILPAAFARQLKLHGVDCAALERVHAMPKQGLSSTFSFGHCYGVMEGTLSALGIPYDLYDPQQWQKAARVGAGKDGSRARAVQLFPAYAEYFVRKADHGRSDAALIAHAFTLLARVETP
jgi:crossover junction endodeoxyribonuclease RuvC